MKKKIFTTTLAIFTIGVAFAGFRFVSEGWYLNVTGTGTRLTEAQARAICPGGNIPCAYHFSEGATMPDLVLFRN